MPSRRRILMSLSKEFHGNGKSAAEMKSFRSSSLNGQIHFVKRNNVEIIVMSNV